MAEGSADADGHGSAPTAEVGRLRAELERMASALHDSEARFTLLTAELQVGVLVQGPNAEILLSNPRAFELLGVTEDQMLGRTSFDPAWNVIHEDGTAFPGPMHPVPQAIATGQSVRNVVMGVYRPARQDRVWLMVNANPTLNEAGGVRQVVCTFFDITARRHAELALLESEARYYALVEWSPEPHVIHADGILRYLNPAAVTMFGASSAQQLVGTKVLDRVHPSSRVLALRRMQDMAQTGDAVPMTLMKYLRVDGAAIDVETQATRIVYEGQPANLVVVRDVTERRQAEEALRESKALLEAVVESVPLVISLKDARDLRFVMFNRAAEQLLGRSRAEVLGKTSLDLLPEAQARAVMARDRGVLEDDVGAATVPEEAVSTAQGARLLHTRKLSIRAPDGSARYLLDVSEDVTARKLAEDSARLAVVGTLAAGAAHEINNPLTYIQANLSWVGEELQALGADRPPGERARLEESARALAEARQGSERIREIVAGLRVFSRKDEPSLGPTDVTQAVKMALQLTTTQRSNQAPTVTRFSPVAPVLANARQLERVFVNLMVNAAQAIPDGQSSTNQISVTVRPGNDGEVVVEVEDTGVGMTPEVRAHLFEPFFTTKAVGVGTGLGLSICHGTVTSFGGRLEVESELGRGSTFRVVLPALTGSVEPSAPVDPASPALPKGARVLVVDDDVAVARALGRMLAGGPEIVTSHDAREALAWLERGDPFDLVICDLMMPLLSGEAFQQRLMSVSPELARSMIFVTGGAFTHAASAFLAATKNVCLEKPVRQSELREVVAAKLR